MRRLPLVLFSPLLAAGCFDGLQIEGGDQPSDNVFSLWSTSTGDGVSMGRDVQVTVGGTARLAIQRGRNVVGPAQVTARGDVAGTDPDAVDTVVEGEQAIAAIGVAEGTTSFLVKIGARDGFFTASAAPAAEALARPARNGIGLLRTDDDDDVLAPVTFVAAPALPVTLGLVSTSGVRAIDLGVDLVGGPPGVTWSRREDDIFVVSGLPVGTSALTVETGATALTMPIDVVAAADAVAIATPPELCLGGPEYAVCGRASLGGREVIAYDWSFAAVAPATSRAWLYGNCTLVTLPDDATAMTVDVAAGNHRERVTIPRPPC